MRSPRPGPRRRPWVQRRGRPPAALARVGGGDWGAAVREDDRAALGPGASCSPRRSASDRTRWTSRGMPSWTTAIRRCSRRSVSCCPSSSVGRPRRSGIEPVGGRRRGRSRGTSGVGGRRVGLRSHAGRRRRRCGPRRSDDESPQL